MVTDVCLSHSKNPTYPFLNETDMPSPLLYVFCCCSFSSIYFPTNMGGDIYLANWRKLLESLTGRLNKYSLKEN